MSKHCFRTLSLAFSCLLLIASTLSVACSNGERKTGEIIIGILTDFTGPAAFATTPTVEQFKYAIRWTEENDPTPGLSIKYRTYDQRTDPARVSAGYMWLKGQGVDLMYVVSPTDNSILAADLERDQMPVIGTNVPEDLVQHPTIFSLWGSNSHDTEGATQWIMDNWDYDGKERSPRLAHLSWTHPTGGFHQAGFTRMVQWYPDELEWLGVEAVPLGTSVFASEIGRIKNADYIFLSPVGAMMASFMKEARDRGYTGAFISGSQQFPGYWPLATAAMPAAQLYDCYFIYWTPFWSEDVPFINDAKKAVNKYSSNPEAIYTGGGPGGWSKGIITITAIKKAVEAVGVENVDNKALIDAFRSITMSIEGFGNEWKILADDKWNVFCRTMKTYKWDIGTATWVDTGTGWVTPPSLKRS